MTDPSAMTTRRRARSWALWAAGAAVVLAIGAGAWAFYHFGLASYLQRSQLQAVLAPLGPWAPVGFMALFVGVVLFSLPSIAMTIAGGALFGFWGGLLLNTIGLNAGAAAAFWIARRLGGRWAAEKLDRRLSGLAHYLDRHGFATIAFIRFTGLLPLALVNYSAGLSRVGFWPYAAGTLIGLLPGMAVYTYLGASLVSFELWKVGLAFGAIALMAVAGFLIRRWRQG